jgi:hypothetical protein
MIRAYAADWFQSVNPDTDLEVYRRKTVLAEGCQAVKAAVVAYLIDVNPEPAVYDFLNALMGDMALLSRTLVVTERQWGNATVLVTPGGVRVGAGAIRHMDGSVDMAATLRYFGLQAEAILHELAETEPAPDALKPLPEAIEWLNHCRFRKQFSGAMGV